MFHLFSNGDKNNSNGRKEHRYETLWCMGCNQQLHGDNLLCSICGYDTYESVYSTHLANGQNKSIPIRWSWGAFGRWVIQRLFLPFLGWWVYSIFMSILVHAVFGWDVVQFYWLMGVVGILAVGLAIGDYLHKSEVISMKVLP